MKKRTAIIIAIVALVAIAAVPLVYAQAPHRGHGRGGDFGGFGMLGRLGHIKAELNLTDDQVTQLKAIFADARQQNAQYRTQLRGGFQSVAQALIANPNDVAGAQALLDQQAAARKAMESNLLAAASKALNVLTPEQRAKLSDMLAKHAANHPRG
jgi:Spy/CpxP family protein refolding chaperone